ncbi:MAG: hypothetical protein GYA29_08290 [Methanothrix sp.]|nr:hypothetical protein [Methanothrix sp.]
MITRKQFLIIISFLLIMLNGYYYYNHAAHQEYLENRDAVEGIEGMSSISGTVSGFATDGFYLHINHASKSKTMEVLSDVLVHEGDFVEALGWTSRGQMVPDKIVVKDRWSYCVVFIISALAGLFVACLFLRSWAFDLGAWRFGKKHA